MVLTLLSLGGCSDFVVLHPTPTVNVPIQSLPPIGFNHRYGNNPIAAADGFDFERSLFSQQVFWEVGVRTDPEIAGFVDRSDPRAVAAARAKITSLIVALATERIHTILGMLAFPQDSAQEQYCIAVLQHFRVVGYTNLTKASVIIFFTEQDDHADLNWSATGGYTFKVNDNDLHGNRIRSAAPPQTPLPAPS
jgi:hypothetical protein